MTRLAATILSLVIPGRLQLAPVPLRKVVNMHYPLEAIPPEAEFAGFAIWHTRVPKGFDLDRLLEGLPNNLCPCPHWGYLIKGRMIVKYEDGSEEEIRTGDVYYARAGHTAVTEEDSVSVDFSPVGPWRQLMQHIGARMATSESEQAGTALSAQS